MKYAFYGWETADVMDSRGLTPRSYYDLLSDIWCADTCAPRMRAEWTPENKTLGQCSAGRFMASRWAMETIIALMQSAAACLT